MKMFIPEPKLPSFAKTQNVFTSFSRQPGTHKERCGFREHHLVVRTDVIAVGVTYKHALSPSLTFSGVEPEAELRQVNPCAGEINFQRHA